jgi:hypothetical protein
MKTIKTIEEVREAIQSHGSVFVRWSEGPDQDAVGGWVSTNYQTKTKEAGLSVNDFPEEPSDYTILKRISEYWYFGHPICYLCAGEIVGKGGAGEPCLSNVEPIAFISEELILSTSQIEAVRLRSAIPKETDRISQIPDRFALALVVERILLSREQLSALEEGRRWFDDVERMKLRIDRNLSRQELMDLL